MGRDRSTNLPRALSGKPQGFSELAAVELRAVPRPRLLAQSLERTARRWSGDSPHCGEARSRHTLGDLLEHLPFDHRDYETPARRCPSLRSARRRRCRSRCARCRVRPTRRRRLKLLECEVADDSGPMKAVWFNQDYLARPAHRGHAGCCCAESSRAARGGPVSGSSSTRSCEARRRGRAATRPGSCRSTRRPRAFRPGASATSPGCVRGLECNSVELLPAALRPASGFPAGRMRSRAAHFPPSLDPGCRAAAPPCLRGALLFQLALVSRRRRASRARGAEPLGRRVRW